MIRNVICTLIGLPLLIYAGYAVILGLFTFRRRPPIPRAQRDSRLCVLCPARNEEAVIGTLIDSLLAQNYPRDRFDIYVLPNHCTDRTEQIARARGARILPIGEDVRTKGDVLRQAFERLRAAHYDAFVIFDADNIVHPDFLARVNDALCAGYDVVQGYRDSKNPQDTWISGDCSIYYWLLNTFFYRARMNIGASSGLNGTGMVIGARALDRVGYDVSSLTEDIEFSILCALGGVRIAFAEEAIFFDEQPLELSESFKQRKRWSVGCNQCLGRYGLSLLRGLLRPGRIACADALLVATAPTIQILLLAASLVMAADMTLGLYPDVLSGAFLIAFSLLSGLLSYLAQVCVALWVVAISRKSVRLYLLAAATFPLFLLTWLPVNLLALLCPHAHWDPIRHGGTVRRSWWRRKLARVRVGRDRS